MLEYTEIWIDNENDVFYGLAGLGFHFPSQINSTVV